MSVSDGPKLSDIAVETNATEYIYVVHALAPSNLLANVASWEESLVLRSGKLSGYYLVTIMVEGITSALAIAMLLGGWKLWALAAQIYLRLLLLTIVYRMMVRPPRLKRPHWGQLCLILRWSVSRYGSVFVAFLSNYSGDLILGVLLSPAATGLYRAGNRIVTAVADMFSQPARMIGMTVLSQRAAAGIAPDGIWMRIVAAIGFVAFPVLFCFALLAGSLTPLLLGQHWAAAAPVVTILCCARAAGLVSGVLSAQLVAYDRPQLVFWGQLVAMISIAILTILLAPFGVASAAWAASIGALFITIAYLLASFRLGRPGRVDWRPALAATLVPLAAAMAGVLVAGSLNLFPSDPILRLLSSGGAAGSAWLVGCILVRRSIALALASLQTRPASA